MKQGEVWLVSLDPTLGAELKKTRPAVVVNDDAIGRLPLKIVVPLTDWKSHYVQAPWMIKVQPDGRNNLTKDSSADCFQVRSLAEERLVKRLGYIDEAILEDIKQGLAVVFGIA